MKVLSYGPRNEHIFVKHLLIVPFFAPRAHFHIIRYSYELYDIYLSVGTSSRLQSESSAVEGFCHPAQAQTQRLQVHPHADPGTAAPLLDGNRPGNDNNALDTMGVTEVLSQI